MQNCKWSFDQFYMKPKYYLMFKEIICFFLPLAFSGLVLQYFFRIDINILLPSVIMFLLFIIVIIISPFTSKKYESQLFSIFCMIQLLALVGGVILMSNQEISWHNFFISLTFQILYWLQLFYYGGLHFTHKFEGGQ